MFVYMIWTLATHEYIGVVFETKEAAERYRERFGNPKWCIEEKFVHSLELVNELSD